MYHALLKYSTIGCLLGVIHPLWSQAIERQMGPLVPNYGAVWAVPNLDVPVDTEKVYRVVFDIYNSPENPAAVNSSLNTLARFLNMHAQAGVPAENLQVAGVIHNKASKDLLDAAAYEERYGVPNPNRQLIQELRAAGAQLYLCGQSAYSRKIDREQMVPGIKVGLSAMTIFLELDANGYQLIKF